MFHARLSEYVPPVVLATLTTVISRLAEAPWLGIGGLCVSAGWLALGWSKHRLDVRRFEAGQRGPA